MIGLATASDSAHETDWLVGSLFGASMLVMGLVLSLMLLYVIRYGHDTALDRGSVAQKTWRIEAAWTVATLVIFFGLFVWGASLFVRLNVPRPDALTISVIGKQWMWKVEHQGGQREINALHLPVGRDVQLLLTSEDVIHDFGLPAFRQKRDLLPGRLEAMWLHPDRVGEYRVYCDQFCGTDHSAMVGTVTVMTPEGYQAWLEANAGPAGQVETGQAAFARYGCAGCHGTPRAPGLAGLFGREVTLADGRTVRADEQYLHDAILFPQARPVAGYAPIMPSFRSVIPEPELAGLVAYIRSLREAPG